MTAIRVTSRNVVRLPGDGPDVTDPEPNDVDRIIAAHRDEARKTRTLLAWIFLGVPAIGLVVWLFVLAANSHTPTSDNPTSGSYDTAVITSDNSGALTMNSPCSDLNSDPGAQQAAETITAGAPPNLQQKVTADLISECHSHPAELLQFALGNAQAEAGDLPPVP